MQGLLEFAKTPGAPRIAAMAAVTLALVGFFAFLILRVTAPETCQRSQEIAPVRRRNSFSALKQFPAYLNRWDSQQARNEGVFAH